MSGPPLLPSAEVFTPAITPINESVASPASKPTNSENGKHNVFSSAKTFSEAVANTTVAASAKFCLSLQHENAEPGKGSMDTLKSFSISPNPEMLGEIEKEKSRLKNYAIFFAAVDIDRCPARKFLDDWFYNYWNLKLGHSISFCRQLQKGLFVIFFKTAEAQEAVLKRQYWNVGNTTFRALAWTPDAIHEEVLALSAPRWIIVKSLPPYLWRFITQLLEPLGKVIRFDESSRLVPHMDARALVSIKPGIEIPSTLEINILGEVISCPLEILGGLNACFLCKKEGHLRRDCPIINKNNNKKNEANPNPKSGELATKKNTAPPANTAVVSPVLSPTPVTLINEQTSTKIAEPTIDVNMSDGFQEVKKKSDKKRRRKTENSEARGNITNKANIPPVTPTTYDPPTHVDINPTPAEAKTFKEIEEGYYLEIVPADKTNKINIPTEPTKDNNMSALSLRSENGNICSKNSEADVDDLEWQKDFPRSKRRGRPPGSKNKSPGGFRTEELSSQNISNRTEGSMELIGVPTNNNFE